MKAAGSTPKLKAKHRSEKGEPVGQEQVEGEASEAAVDEEIAVELPVEQNDHNAQTS